MLLDIDGVPVATAIVESLTLMQQGEDYMLSLPPVVWHFAFSWLLFRLSALVLLIMKIYTII